MNFDTKPPKPPIGAPPSTVAIYTTMWKQWTNYCETRGHVTALSAPLPVSCSETNARVPTQTPYKSLHPNMPTQIPKILQSLALMHRQCSRGLTAS